MQNYCLNDHIMIDNRVEIGECTKMRYYPHAQSKAKNVNIDNLVIMIILFKFRTIFSDIKKLFWRMQIKHYKKVIL